MEYALIRNGALVDPDLRGRVVAGFDPENSTGRLTAAVNAALLGSAGGEQTHTLAAGEIPSLSVSVSVGGSISGTTSTLNEVSVTPGSSLASSQAAGTPFAGLSVSGSFSGSGSGGTTNTGNAAHNNIQPTIVAQKLLRIQ
jgi:microcystin-dependent protein